MGADLTTIEMIYAGCAVFGGILFVIRIILMFMGGDSDTDADAGGFHGDVGIDGDIDAHADVDLHVDGDLHADVDHGGSDASFKILSLHGLTGFFMMFGLIGLGAYRSFENVSTGMAVSLVAGVAAGLFAVWLVTKVFSMMSKLQSSGTLDLANAVGQEGTVYLKIPAEGRGKVQITVQGRLQEFEAVSEAKVELASGDRVKVARVVSDSVMSVEKA